MSAGQSSVFRRALVASGLLRAELLNQVESELASGPGHLPRPTAAAISADELAAALVARGLLNAWQVEQLRLGRSKFNLGPYLMLDSLGQGGMGQVFKAEHTIMGRIVAVKVLPRHRSSPEALASFHREIRAQAQLDHHNLVRALDAGRDGNVHFLVTEFVPGLDLRRLVRQRGRLNVPAATAIVSQAAQGLAHAHAKGMIHRDIKPGNLLVTPEGLVKVSDLGLVGFFGETALDEAHPGKIVGTADYLSPEQILWPGKIGPASDVYGLGCTLYYALTGKVPFPGGTTRDKAHAHCHLQPVDPRRLNPELPDALVDTLADMMAKELEQRVASADEVVERLRPWARQDAAAQAAGFSTAAPADASSGALASSGAWPDPRGQQSDTQPSFVVRAAAHEETSSGETSQATHREGQDREETIRIVLDQTLARAAGPWWSRAPRGVRWLLAAGAVLVLAALGAAVAELLRRG